MNQPLKPTTDAIVDLINTYLNLEPKTALVIATAETSCTELIDSGEAKTVEDIATIADAIQILTAGDYYHSAVIPLGKKYIVHNHEIIVLADKTIHRADG